MPKTKLSEYQSHINKLVEQCKQRIGGRAWNVLAKLSGTTNDTIHRFFRGYTGQATERLLDAEGLGRVNLTTAVAIIAMLGGTVQIDWSKAPAAAPATKARPKAVKAAIRIAKDKAAKQALAAKAKRLVRQKRNKRHLEKRLAVRTGRKARKAS